VEQRPVAPKNVPKPPSSGLPIAPVIQTSQHPQGVKKIVMAEGAPKKKTWVLSDQEKTTYGDRVPKGYEKLDLLGK